MDELIEKANKEGLISFVGEEKNQLYYKKLGHTVSFLEEKEHKNNCRIWWSGWRILW